ncbi:DUF6973 domain-containing protein [Hydrogenophaga luteola]|uniref:DUF6973 domain-containing protein n=1 Tax=Hydrogenophaga luteola TaxID=1591122 RepID=A0ABV7W757_9BURK
MSESRPSLEALRSQYQVPDDEMIRYRPRVFGAFDVPFTESLAQGMTRTEGALLDRMTWDRGLSGLKTFHDIYIDAFRQCESQFPDNQVPASVPAHRAGEWQGNDGHRDAFRHTYWSARLAQEYGPDWALAFTSAHEGAPGNPANREAMDLYNNSIGIKIGAENPKATPEQLAALVRQAVNEGRTVVMNSAGQLEWSDRVPVGEHGLAPQEKIDPHMKKPEVVPTKSAAAQELSPHARKLLNDSEQQVRQLAERHGLPWDQGMDNTVAAVAHHACANGLTGINQFHVTSGQIRFGQCDGYTIKDGSIDARVAANTPAEMSQQGLLHADQAMNQLQDSRVTEHSPPTIAMRA